MKRSATHNSGLAHSPMITPHWEHFEHEADIGVHGIGNTIEEAFIQAAIAMAAVITEPKHITPQIKIEINCEAPDHELLFVDWLNALIYEMSSRKYLFSRFEIRINTGELHACAWGEKIDISRHQPVVEIKGATYTSLKVYQDEDGTWHAKTVIDV